jgi:hypothetical protein
LITKSVESALEIAEKIQSGEVQLDAATITELVSKQTTGTESQLINVATLAIIICWVIGIIDSRIELHPTFSLYYEPYQSG